MEKHLQTQSTDQLTKRLRSHSLRDPDLCWAIVLELDARDAMSELDDSQVTHLLQRLVPSERERAALAERLTLGTSKRLGVRYWERHEFVIKCMRKRGLEPKVWHSQQMLDLYEVFGYAPAAMQVWNIILANKYLDGVSAKKSTWAYNTLLKTYMRWSMLIKAQPLANRSSDTANDILPKAAELLRQMAERGLHSGHAVSVGLRILRHADQPKLFRQAIQQAFHFDVKLPSAPTKLQESGETLEKVNEIDKHVLNTILLALSDRGDLSSMIAVFEACSSLPAASASHEFAREADHLDASRVNTTTFAILMATAIQQRANVVARHYFALASAFTLAEWRRLRFDLQALKTENGLLSRAASKVRMPSVGINNYMLQMMSDLAKSKMPPSHLATIADAVYDHLTKLDTHQRDVYVELARLSAADQKTPAHPSALQIAQSSRAIQSRKLPVDANLQLKLRNHVDLLADSVESAERVARSLSKLAKERQQKIVMRQVQRAMRQRDEKIAAELASKQREASAVQDDREPESIRVQVAL